MDALGSFGSVHPLPFFPGEVFLGTSELLKRQLVFQYFCVRERGTVILLKAVLAFLAPRRALGCGRKAGSEVGSLLEIGKGPQNFLHVRFGVV